MTRRFPLACALATAVALTAGACGNDSNTTASSAPASTAGAPASGTTFAGATDKGTLSGAGSTFVTPMVQEWIKRYKAAAPGVTLNYQGVGSGAGVQQLTSKTVDFAGSDGALKDTEQAATGGAGAVVQVPWVAGGIAVEYNLAGVKSLRLSSRTIAGIFGGTIGKWDDPAIKADNPGTSLPGKGIQVVHRSDGSGTTQVFTEYLKATAPELWTFGSSKDWPAGTPGTGAKGSDGVTAAVKQAEGAIGYSEVSYPQQAGLGTAQVMNKAGRFTSPTAGAVSAALAGATVNPDLTLKLDYAPDAPDAYAISTTTYLMFYRSSGDGARDTMIRHFATWVLTDGQKLAESLDYAPMPQPILTQALAAINAQG